jgi:hypothetical protein
MRDDDVEHQIEKVQEELARLKGRGATATKSREAKTRELEQRLQESYKEFDVKQRRVALPLYVQCMNEVYCCCSSSFSEEKNNNNNNASSSSTTPVVVVLPGRGSTNLTNDEDDDPTILQQLQLLPPPPKYVVRKQALLCHALYELHVLDVQIAMIGQKNVVKFLEHERIRQINKRPQIETRILTQMATVSNETKEMEKTYYKKYILLLQQQQQQQQERRVEEEIIKNRLTRRRTTTTTTMTMTSRPPILLDCELLDHSSSMESDLYKAIQLLEQQERHVTRSFHRSVSA